MRLVIIYITLSFLSGATAVWSTPSDTAKEHKPDLIFLLSLNVESPMALKSAPNLVFPNAISAGLGSTLIPTLEVYLTYNLNGNTKIIPNESYFVQGWYREFGVEARYFYYSTLFLLGGIHLTTMRSRDFEQYNSSTRQYEETTRPQVRTNIVSGSVGIGLAKDFGFIELRHHRGFTTFHVIEDFKGTLETWSFRFGFNFYITFRQLLKVFSEGV